MTERPWLDRRRAGVLLHLSSLPGPFASGTLGNAALAFVERIREAGFTVWQFLPLGPTHAHGSPYEALSSMAGNPEMLDLAEFADRGWIEPLPEPPLSKAQHARLRAQAAECYWSLLEENAELARATEAYLEAERDWLDDFALFAALKQAFDGRAWWQWPEPLRDRDPAALEAARERFAPEIRRIQFEQLMFDRQWRRLRLNAERLGVRLFGDLPIYVAHDSADVWAHRELFTINDLGLCEEVAGVPPDYFSPTGQRWGNPLYRWERHEAEGFAWWIRRLRRELARAHLVRIDHFRGLESYWAIPAESLDGIVGEWRKAPGEKLLETIRQSLGGLPLVAEDLGFITPEVVRLRERFGLPGMKILQFAFDGNPDNPYLPEHHEENSVVYTGTHDNDTTLGWWQGLSEDEQRRVRDILGNSGPMPDALIETALASPARLAVIPVQDLLRLDSRARLNTPGTLEGNWIWRLGSLPDAEALAPFARMIKETGRLPGG